MAGEDPEVPSGGEPVPAEAPAETPAGTEAPEPASTGTGEPDAKAVFLQDLKGRLERGELAPEDLSDYANRKLQSVASTLAGKFDRVRERTERMISSAGEGVKLPEGKTPFDVFTDPDPSAFTELMESLPTARAQRQRLQGEQLIQAQQEGILEGLKQFPDLKPDIQQITQVIVSDPTLNGIANASPEYIPLLVAGVGRDLQVQRANTKVTELEAANKELKEALRANGIVQKTKGESSKAKNTAPGKAPAEEPSDLRSIAAGVLQRIKSGEIPVH